MSPTLLEVVVYNFSSALEAIKGGADRLELCDNPSEGGTTPSLGMIDLCRKNINIDLFVMIRPRGGDFNYSKVEIEIMKKDIMACKRFGIDGVVFGVLEPEGHIHRAHCKELIQLAKPMQVTCHRAFDMTSDPLKALEDCIEVGFDRILTSGGIMKAIDGLALISSLIEKANGRIKIMPGSGINEQNVTKILDTTGANEIHLSASIQQESEMFFINTAISSMGTKPGSAYQTYAVDRTILLSVRGKVNTRTVLPTS